MSKVTDDNKPRSITGLLGAICFCLLMCCQLAGKGRPTFVIENPYARGRHWYRGDLHMHAGSAEEAKELYRAEGYSFLAQLRNDSPVYDNSGLTERDFVMLNGSEVELSDFFYQTVHVTPLEHPPGDYPDINESFDFMDRTRENGGLNVYNHPGAWYPLLDADTIASDPDFSTIEAIEIFNGKRARWQGTDDNEDGHRGIAVWLWDDLLARGLRVWGTAADDAESLDPEHYAGPFSGWIEVRAPRLSRKSILQALRRGSFIASTGVRVLDIRVTHDTILIVTDSATTIRFIGQGPEELKVVDGRRAWYRARGDEGYIRVEGNNDVVAFPEIPVTQGFWTQPFFIRQLGSAPR